jgi:hypothetical protein
MRAMLRNVTRRVRRWSGSGAVHNARLEVDRASRSVTEIDRQLRRVTETPPRRAA